MCTCSYKIDRAIFSVWASLLQNVTGSTGHPHTSAPLRTCGTFRMFPWSARRLVLASVPAFAFVGTTEPGTAMLMEVAPLIAQDFVFKISCCRRSLASIRTARRRQRTQARWHAHLPPAHAPQRAPSRLLPRSRHCRREAARAGVEPARLIFSEPLGAAEHLLAKHRADLLLDTPAFNAHGTAADALWAGVPVLTAPVGEAMAARLGSSVLLLSQRSSATVARTLGDYFEVAARVAHRPGVLRRVRGAIEAARGAAALFDLGRWMGAWERLLGTLYDCGRLCRPAVRSEVVPMRALVLGWGNRKEAGDRWKLFFGSVQPKMARDKALQKEEQPPGADRRAELSGTVTGQAGWTVQSTKLGLALLLQLPNGPVRRNGGWCHAARAAGAQRAASPVPWPGSMILMTRGHGQGRTWTVRLRYGAKCAASSTRGCGGGIVALAARWHGAPSSPPSVPACRWPGATSRSGT